MYHKCNNNKCNNNNNNNNLKILYLLICSILMFWVVSSSNSKELRRITLEELEADPYLMTGAQPFVLTGAMETWESLNKFQDLNFFIKNYPNTIVDHYPRNLANPKDKPYLQAMETVMQGFIDKHEEQEKYGDPSVPFEERYKHSQYIHWRMTLPEYQKIEEMFQPLPKFMKVDEVWMKKCFPDKQDDHDWPLNNFFRHAHWRIIVIGEKNSSMFLHADGFDMPSDPPERVPWPRIDRQSHRALMRIHATSAHGPCGHAGLKNTAAFEPRCPMSTFSQHRWLKSVNPGGHWLGLPCRRAQQGLSPSLKKADFVVLSWFCGWTPLLPPF